MSWSHARISLTPDVSARFCMHYEHTIAEACSPTPPLRGVESPQSADAAGAPRHEWVTQHRGLPVYHTHDRSDGSSPSVACRSMPKMSSRLSSELDRIPFAYIPCLDRSLVQEAANR